MCGIVGYLGTKNAVNVLLDSLKALEYRGYDSAGLAIQNNNQIEIYKSAGRVEQLENLVNQQERFSHIGIGHTRWATHGEPTHENAHPHFSSNRKIALIHNGIIENYADLKQELIDKGYQFRSQTDTEVVAYLIEDIQQLCPQYAFKTILELAFKRIIGAYAMIIYHTDEPNRLYVLRNSSPLVVGLTEDDNSFFVASDATCLVPYTQDIVYLNDMELAILDYDSKSLDISCLTNGTSVKPEIHRVELDLLSVQKGGYDTFMIKEIFEQPKSMRDSIRGRLSSQRNYLVLGGIREHIAKLVNAKRIIIIGCGTSWHSALIAEYMLEEWTRIPVEVEYASEFRYRNPIIDKSDIVIAVSQSGETADTLAAAKIAKSKGATLLSICNTVGSSLARLSHAGVYTHAGPEIGVASTKAFSSQIIVFAMIALQIAQKRATLPEKEWSEVVEQLEIIPDKIQKILDNIKTIEEIAYKYSEASNFLYLGRGVNFPLALEGALKLKEISYIHAEGYPAAEMKHGPIALVDANMPSIFIATGDYLDKITSNIQEVKARRGKVIAIVDEENRSVAPIVDHIIEVPATHPMLTPLLTVLPLQLLAYYIATFGGKDVDKPRNLAKSVTVE